ncbi:MAG: ABC transporter substrate-binding protein [Oscillospiraceae bacterium]|jgi:peptide/nickel transport system substrate-binding protein|nr:ABC transporter substrate-binding protein [Oscillospiraceae bacterium]
MKNNTKKLISALLACILVVSLFACGKPGTTTPTPPASDAPPVETTAAAPAKDTFYGAVSLDSGTLDPVGITGAGGFLAMMYSYMEPLLDTKANGERVWVLATGIDTIDDIHSVIHVREGVTFSNGNPLTAADVLFTLKMYLDVPSQMMAVMYIDFEKTTIIDDYTIDLWYTSAITVNEDGKLSTVMIVDSESYDPQAMSANPIGTGPYIVTDYVVNSHTSLTAREDYWGAKPAIKNLYFKVINETSQVTNALEIGEIDYGGVPTTDVEYIESLGKFNIAQSNAGYATAAYYNMSSTGLLATKEARYAIDFAIDREAIVELCFNGYASVVDWPCSEAMLDFEERFAGLHETYALGFNLDQAKEYAEKAGLVGKTIRIMTNGASSYTTMAEIIQEDLGKIGVTAVINNYDQATYYAMMSDPSNYEVALYATAAPNVRADGVLNNTFFFFPLGWEGPEKDTFMALSTIPLAGALKDPKVRSDELFEVVKAFEEISPFFGICDTPTLSAIAKTVNVPAFYLDGSPRYQEMSFAS